MICYSKWNKTFWTNNKLLTNKSNRWRKCKNRFFIWPANKKILLFKRNNRKFWCNYWIKKVLTKTSNWKNWIKKILTKALSCKNWIKKILTKALSCKDWDRKFFFSKTLTMKKYKKTNKSWNKTMFFKSKIRN